MELLFIAFEMFVYNGISRGIVFKANICISLKNNDMLNFLHHGTRKFYMIQEALSA